MDRIAKLNEMLKRQPADAFLRHALGLEYVKAGDEEAAERLFRGVLEDDPAYVGTYYQLASLLIRQGRDEDARVVCEDGLRVCKEAGDDHSWRELNNIYQDLLY